MKRGLAAGILLLGGAVLPVVAVDTGLRLGYPETHLMAVDPELGNVLQPDMATRRAYGGHERVVHIRTNRLGLRVGDEPPVAQPAARRILALGDSFTFGDGVEWAEAWPHRLEARLDAGGTRRYEVNNAGVAGYGTAQELLLYERLERTLRPDLVVLGFTVVNDVLDNLCVDEGTYRPRPNTPCFTLDGDRLTLHPPVPPPAAYRRAALTSLPGARALDLLRDQARQLVLLNPRLIDAAQRFGAHLTLPYMPGTIASWYDDRYTARGWPLTRRLLIELRDRLAPRGVPLVVLVVPASLQADGGDGGKQAILRKLGGDREPVRAFLRDPRRPQAMMAAFCREARVACVDPLPALLDAQAHGGSVYYSLDQHWTPLGHAIAAELLARRLTGRGGLAGPPARSAPAHASR